MPLNERKIITIILEECRQAPKRCELYHAELVECISDIVQAERRHRIAGTNIQQQVTAKCSALGEFIMRQMGTS